MTSPRSPRVPVEDLLAEAGWLRALARRLVRDSSTADDVTQCALTAALEHPPARGRPLRPWLATVLRNRVRASRRAEDRRRTRERLVARVEPTSGEDEVLVQFDEQRRLAELIVQLDEPYRLILVRHFYRGESLARIARATGRPSATVRAQLARALIRLRELHAREHRGDRSRSQLALVLAAGRREVPLAAPFAAASLSSLFAMKTTTKILAAVFAVLLLVGGREVYRALRAPVGDPALALPTDAKLRAPAGTARASVPAQDSELPEREAIAGPDADATAAREEVDARTALALRAVDEGGLSIRGARLVFVERNGAPRDLPRSEPSGDDGRIVVDVDRRATFSYVGTPDRLSPVRLYAPGFASLFLVETIVEGALVEIGDRELAPGGDVHGRVLDAHGARASGIEVVALIEKSEGSSRVVFMGGEGPNDFEPSLRTWTDANGEFALEGVELRPIRLWFRVAGLRWNKSEVVELAAGEVRRDVELLLPLVEPASLISGRVFHPDGSPAPEAQVRTRAGEYWSEDPLSLDSSGRFVYQPGYSGTLQFMADDPTGTFSSSVAVEGMTGGAELRLELLPANRRTIVVTDESAEPIERAWMMAYVDEAGVDENWSHTDADGRCSMLLPAVEFSLRVGCEGYEAVWVGPLDPADMPEEIAVTLRRHPELHGVVLAGGTPISGARVQLVHALREDLREVHKGFTTRFFGDRDAVETDADGRFRVPLEDPAQERWSLLVEKEGYARTEHFIGRISDVEEASPIEVILTRGGTLEGRVLVAANRDPGGLVVACSREDGRPLVTRTDAEGRYRFEHLTPGGWLVEDRESPPAGSRSSMISAGEMPFAPNADILEGATTTLDLDTRWKENLAVHGRLRFDGAGATGWTATLDPSHALEDARTFAPVPLDAEGGYAAPACPGPATLILRSPASDPVRRSIEHELLVGPHMDPVEIELATGTLRGAGHPPGDRLRVFFLLPSGARTIHEFAADADGAFEVSGLPAGHLRLQRDGGRGWETLARPQLGAGEVLDVK